MENLKLMMALYFTNLSLQDFFCQDFLMWDFFLSIVDVGPGLMTTSSLVLNLKQFLLRI